MGDVFPGPINSIRSHVRLSLDIRDTDLAHRDSMMRNVEEAAKKIAAQRRVSIQTSILNADAPADCDREVVETLSKACEEHHLTFLPMISRAYHDSLFMSRIAPTAMLFIPCENVYSHRPDQHSSIADITHAPLL